MRININPKAAVAVLGTVALASLAVSGMATADGAPSKREMKKMERLAAFEPTGKTENCVQLHRIDSTEVLDDKTILFHMIGNQTYRNDLPYACPSLGFEERFAYKTSINQLCNVDIITVLQSGAGLHRGASCGLGTFTELTEKPKDAKGAAAPMAEPEASEDPGM